MYQYEDGQDVHIGDVVMHDGKRKTVIRIGPSQYEATPCVAFAEEEHMPGFGDNSPGQFIEFCTLIRRAEESEKHLLADHGFHDAFKKAVNARLGVVTPEQGDAALVLGHDRNGREVRRGDRYEQNYRLFRVQMELAVRDLTNGVGSVVCDHRDLWGAGYFLAFVTLPGLGTRTLEAYPDWDDYKKWARAAVDALVTEAGRAILRGGK